MQTLRAAPSQSNLFIKPLDLNRYRSPLLRALAWSCFSAPLLQADEQLAAAPALKLNRRRQDWLAALDSDDRPLRKYLEQRCPSPRLGLVFESLWHFFLEHDPQTELLANNLAVRHNGRTLGEFDIIYRDLDSGAAIHLELAVKFFLATGTGPLPMSAWRGPNSADRLDRKLARLQEHQLQLSLSDAGRSALKGIGIDHCERQLRVAGTLFYAGGQAATTSGLHPDHCRGHWLRAAALNDQWQAHTEHEFPWRLLEKPQWLNADYEGAEPLNDSIVKRTFRRPLMLINANLERCFVVPQNWPAPANH